MASRLWTSSISRAHSVDSHGTTPTEESNFKVNHSTDVSNFKDEKLTELTAMKTIRSHLDGGTCTGESKENMLRETLVKRVKVSLIYRENKINKIVQAAGFSYIKLGN
jgi:hypothetical protein